MEGCLSRKLADSRGKLDATLVGTNQQIGLLNRKFFNAVLSKSRAFYTVAIARNRVGVVGMLEVHGGLSNIHRGQWYMYE